MELGKLLGCVDWYPVVCHLRQSEIIIKKYNSTCRQTTKYQSCKWHNSKEVSYWFDMLTIIVVVF